MKKFNINDLPRNFESTRVWEIFDEIRKIPRKSGSEEMVRNWIINWALERSIDYVMDQAGNLCLKSKATYGFEDRPTILLQSHMDMVCEKDDEVDFDFSKDPIKLITDGKWLKADRTTLGADNGIGLAASLAILDEKSIDRGALEVLITVEEETTFRGALEFSPSDMDLNSTIILNLDNEEIDKVFYASAGLQTIYGNLPLSLDTANLLQKAIITFTNFPGGHSGADIHRSDIKNPIQQMFCFLKTIPPNSFRVLKIEGGTRDNVIPRSCHLEIGCDDFDSIKELLTKFVNSNGGFENYTTIVKKGNINNCYRYITEEINTMIINVMSSINYGPLEFDEKRHVQTSQNFAKIHMDDSQLDIVISFRSTNTSEIEALIYNHSNSLTSHGFSIEVSELTPGWNGNPESPAIKAAIDAYKFVTGTEATAESIHAGIEVGEIQNKLSVYLGKEVDAASFGPTILDAHSPNEKIKISDVEIFYKQLIKTIQLLSS